MVCGLLLPVVIVAGLLAVVSAVSWQLLFIYASNLVLVRALSPALAVLLALLLCYQVCTHFPLCAVCLLSGLVSGPGDCQLWWWLENLQTPELGMARAWYPCALLCSHTLLALSLPHVSGTWQVKGP